jgi:vanillate/4-hydroxybenzoate decarboxylase subunit D
MSANESACPRCRGGEVEMNYQGKEAGRVLWRILHCLRCSFTWRDSEPPESIVTEQRDSFFNVKPDDIDRYPIVLAPVP